MSCRPTCRANGRCLRRPMTLRSAPKPASGMVERVQFVERLGFDWISVSEHHYSPRILTPSPVVSAAWLAARVDSIKIALLGPIVPTSNPIRVAEELAMLDTLAPGRFVVRHAARHHQRIPQLRPQSGGSARAHRRRHGADPEGLERTAAVRLAGAVFPISHRIAVAAPAATAGADLCAGHQRGSRRRSPRGIILASVSRTAIWNRWAVPPAITVSNARSTAGRRGRTTSSGAST